MVKWRLPAVLAGVPPLYRLDRLSGRYDDAGQAGEARSTIYDLQRTGAWTCSACADRYPHWLPMVDTMFGSGVYLPLVDGGHYGQPDGDRCAGGAPGCGHGAAPGRRLRLVAPLQRLLVAPGVAAVLVVAGWRAKRR